jgi:uncharacterized FlaG/YvyC family protein
MNIEPIGGGISSISNQYHSESKAAVNVEQGSKQSDKPKEAPSKQKASSTAQPIVSATTTEYVVNDSLKLIQAITKNSMTTEVIRKMPSDDYVKLLNIMKEIVPSSLDQRA